MSTLNRQRKVEAQIVMSASTLLGLDHHPAYLRGYGAIPPLKSESKAFIPFVKRQFPNIDLQVFLDGIEHGTAESEAWYPAASRK